MQVNIMSESMMSRAFWVEVRSNRTNVEVRGVKHLGGCVRSVNRIRLERWPRTTKVNINDI